MSAPVIATPQPPALSRPWFIPSDETLREQKRILAGRFFLVKIAGNGEVWRCRRCGGKHRYLTLGCIEQPFSGLTRGLYAYYKTLGVHGAERYLSPSERARYAELARMFGPLGAAPDLATAHPRTARALGTAERDADLGALTFTATEPSAAALGIVERISRDKAARLVARINQRVKPPLILEGLNDGTR